MKKRLLLTVVLATLALFFVIVTGFLLIRQDVAFRIFEHCASFFRRSDCQAIEIETESVEVSTLHGLISAQMLISSDYPIPENFAPALIEIDDHKVSSEISSSFLLLRQAIYEKYQDTVMIRSSYRTREEQEEIYGTLTPDIAAKVGASEHQIGLSLDVYIEGTTGGAILTTKAGRYLHRHCHEYGFILRYPYGKSDITGISYEPWHIRYVGLPHATIIYEEDLTLEEYVFEFLKENVYFQEGKYLISRQIPSDGKIQLPKQYTSLEVSPDNCGGYIITATIDESPLE